MVARLQVWKTVEEQLTETGLRLAKPDESGWYVTVWDYAKKDTKKVWATDMEQGK